MLTLNRRLLLLRSLQVANRKRERSPATPAWPYPLLIRDGPDGRVVRAAHCGLRRVLCRPSWAILRAAHPQP